MSNPTTDWAVIPKAELQRLRDDREWADYFCRMFLRADHKGDLDLMHRHMAPLTRYARIRNIPIPHHE